VRFDLRFRPLHFVNGRARINQYLKLRVNRRGNIAQGLPRSGSGRNEKETCQFP